MYGNLINYRIKDYQSEAWAEVKGDQILFMRGNDSSYLRYDTILIN